MSCLENAELRRQRIRSRNIDLQLKEEKKRSPHVHRLLVLGTEDSDKSTVVKQIKIYSDGYSTQERYRERRNVRATIRHIIQAAIDLVEDPSMSLCDQLNIPKLQFINDNISYLPLHHNDFPREFYEYCDALWQDEGIKQCLMRCKHHPLLLSNSAEYFMQSSKLLEVSQDGYEPSDKDILKSREWNRGFTMTNVIFRQVHFEFLVANHKFYMIRKWAQHIHNELTAIVFVVDISSYNLVSEDSDKTKNKLAESLAYFKETCEDNRSLRHVPVILFFNGIDQLKKKIMDEDIPVVDYFPEFKHYRPPPPPQPVSGNNSDTAEYIEPTPFEKAKWFFKETFMMVKERNYGSLCYTDLFTSMDDITNMRKLFDITKDIILTKQIESVMKL